MGRYPEPSALLMQAEICDTPAIMRRHYTLEGRAGHPIWWSSPAIEMPISGWLARRL